MKPAVVTRISVALLCHCFIVIEFDGIRCAGVPPGLLLPLVEDGHRLNIAHSASYPHSPLQPARLGRAPPHETGRGDSNFCCLVVSLFHRHRVRRDQVRWRAAGPATSTGRGRTSAKHCAFCELSPFPSSTGAPRPGTPSPSHLSTARIVSPRARAAEKATECGFVDHLTALTGLLISLHQARSCRDRSPTASTPSFPLDPIAQASPVRRRGPGRTAPTPRRRRGSAPQRQPATVSGGGLATAGLACVRSLVDRQAANMRRVA